MDLKGKSIVITGAGRGIGRALARRFAQEGPRGITVADLDGAAARSVAAEIGGAGVDVDLAGERGVQRLVAEAERNFGPIDLFCSNAGILTPGGVELPDADWERTLDINFRAHLWAARAVLPGMLGRGGGYLLQTVSAAGLLTQLGSAPYAVSKHAALALAEWIAMTHGDRGIRVSCICPQGVRTPMLLGEDGDGDGFLVEGAISAEAVAEAAVVGVREERFLILPHPEVAEYARRKADDPDRWLRGMRRLQAEIERRGR